MNATTSLARLAEFKVDDIPDDVMTVASQCLLDGVGVALAGANEPAARHVAHVMGAGSDGPATILGTSLRSSLSAAATINGTAMHALDYDDVSAPMVGHPTAPVLPAVLALAEQRDASVREMLIAFVAGVEAEVRLAIALGPSHYQAGFHTTATAGAVGAAVACSRLLGLDRTRTCHAISTAATQASGLKETFGSDAKPFQVGRAAEAGLVAALLAERGFTSGLDVVGGRQGLGATHSGAWNPVGLDEVDTWHVLDVLFKFHAACYLTHGAIDGILALTTPEDLPRNLVDSVELRVSPRLLGVCAIEDPRTALAGKFSLKFVSALVMRERRATEDLFTDAMVDDGELRQMMDRISVVPTADATDFVSRVTVTRAGTSSTRTIDTSTRPWSSSPVEQWNRLEDKFRGVTRTRIGADSATAAIAMTRSEEKIRVRELLELVAP